MLLTIVQRRKLRTAGRIVLAGLVIGLVYPLFADGFTKFLPYINGALIGVIGGSFVSLMELEIFDFKKRRRSFIITLMQKVTLYFLFFACIIPLIMGFTESIYYDRGYWEHITSQKFQHFLHEEDFGIILFYAFTFILIIIFTRQISRKMGQGVLVNYISGRFHQPREVERIFMFLDIRSSTTIAEKLGGIKFHRFLHDFFTDISASILASKGVIYRYVGDQVVVTWKIKAGIENANCIRTYFKIKSKMKLLHEKYYSAYGFVPRFSTSFNCGKVVVGEIGEVKSQIVYHGELLYQTAAIEKQFSKHDLKESILISENLIKLLPIPSLYKIDKVAEIDNFEGGTMDIYTLIESGE